MIVADLRDAAGDMWAVWTSPFHATARDYAAAGAALLVFAAVTPFDDNIDRWIVGNPSNEVVRAVHPFREHGAVPLAGHDFLPIAGGLYAAGLAFRSPELRDAVMGCAAAYGAETVSRTAITKLIARTRPAKANGDQYDFDVPGADWNRHSFFGGHAANIMACATYWNHRFALGVAEPALYAVAIGVGLARMADRRHWASDTVLGEIYGYAIGRVVATRARQRAAWRSGGRGASPGVSPDGRRADGGSAGAYVEGGPSGLVLGWRATL
jgi:membrane-associated phospholipid phosphatase